MSDRATNRLALVWPLLAIATAALAFLASPAAATHTQASTVALVLAAFCLLGPYSLLAGAIALDFGGRRGSATAAGLIDTAGYLGAVLSGYLLGTIVESQGWPAVFLTLAGVCFASVVVVWIYTRKHATVAAPQRLSV
jgi:MFS transporter, OPA family, glycerol-3-phosphate transporter